MTCIWRPSVYGGHFCQVPRVAAIDRFDCIYIYIYFSFQPVLHDWCNKGRGVCYPVCGMVDIKEPLLLIRKSSTCGDSGFPLSLSLPYVRRHITVTKCVECAVK